MTLQQGRSVLLQIMPYFVILTQQSGRQLLREPAEDVCPFISPAGNESATHSLYGYESKLCYNLLKTHPLNLYILFTNK